MFVPPTAPASMLSSLCRLSHDACSIANCCISSGVILWPHRVHNRHGILHDAATVTVDAPGTSTPFFLLRLDIGWMEKTKAPRKSS